MNGELTKVLRVLAINKQLAPMLTIQECSRDKIVKKDRFSNDMYWIRVTRLRASYLYPCKPMHKLITSKCQDPTSKIIL